jgi:Uma2 family endonuclease
MFIYTREGNMSSRPLLTDYEEPLSAAEQMSFDQLMADAEQETAPAEVVSARPAKPPLERVTGQHQDVRLYLTLLLKTFVEMTDSGLVRDAPFEVRLSEDRVYQPDIVFIANSGLDRVHEDYIEGAPSIILEILTADSTALDRGEKFVAYEAYGVREYWIIDPVRDLADLYHLGPNGLYTEFRPDIAGRLRSRALRGLAVDIDRLWKRVMPTTAEVLEMVQEMVSHR